jgi:hypothetical protein
MPARARQNVPHRLARRGEAEARRDVTAPVPDLLLHVSENLPDTAISFVSRKKIWVVHNDPDHHSLCTPTSGDPGLRATQGL